MSIALSTNRSRRMIVRAAVVALAAVTVACGSETTTTEPAVQTTRSYNQVQRLGNPLVSEVFLPKKDHQFHGSVGPCCTSMVPVALTTCPARVCTRGFCAAPLAGANHSTPRNAHMKRCVTGSR